MSQASNPDPASYASFNAFFTRALKAGARPLAAQPNTLLCPVDGRVSEAGSLTADSVLQAKGRDYSMRELLGGRNQDCDSFENGKFATLYLSPRDYHRIHMPLAGKLTAMHHIPGRLFSVAPHTVRVVPRLFARNERVVALFDTEAGKLAMVLVGAINVAAIETVWAGLVTPPAGRQITHKDYPVDAPTLDRAAEMGRFNMGSTVILITEPHVEWNDSLVAGRAVQMGQAIGGFSSESQ